MSESHHNVIKTNKNSSSDSKNSTGLDEAVRPENNIFWNFVFCHKWLSTACGDLQLTTAREHNDNR